MSPKAADSAAAWASGVDPPTGTLRRYCFDQNGTGVGASLGFALAQILDRYKLIRVPVDVYQISHVPFRVLPLDFTLVVVAAILVSFVATIYPSRQAAKLDPAQALRYE